MKITALNIENFMRVRAVSITPDGNIVTVAGDNGEGKTSTLNAVAAAIGGADLCPKEPLRHGARQGHAEVKLDNELLVRRSWTPKGTTLTVTSIATGLPLPKPQAILDALVGKLSFDPLAFERSKQADQVETLRKLAGIDMAPLDARRQKAYDERTEVGREVKRLEGALAKMPPVSGDAPVMQSVAGLSKELDEARKINAAREEKSRAIDRLRDAKASIEAEIEELKKKLASAEERLASTKTVGRSLVAERDAMPTADEASILAKLSTIEANNAKARAFESYRSMSAELDAAASKAEDLTKAIADIDDQKRALLEQSKLPVAGLTFDDSGVRLDDVPFAQASAAQRIRASAAIGLALNPKLRVLLIRDASLLDKKSMLALGEFATENDAQVWVERIETAGATVVIEDGQVQGDEQQEVDHTKSNARASREEEFRARNAKSAEKSEPGAQG